MPSRESATDEYTEAFPEDEPFIAGGEYGRGPINAPDMTQVVADLNSQLEGLRDANLEQMMESFDTNASAVLEQ
jgi:multiple sugar transport system substrate-binding protein